MDEERKTQKTEEKPKKKGTERNNVIIVQTLACAFLIFLAAAANKLSPESFELLRNEYNQLMLVDMSAKEVAESAMGAAQSVMSVQTSAAEPEEAEETAEEKKDDAVAVMAELGSDKGITVPVHGRISSEYGYRTNPISGAYALHTGVDIAADEGTDIVAAYSGVVKDTGTGVKRGKYVLMKHSDGSETLYCHCSKILVEEDDVIRAGEVVAQVGSTGWATGPHLHFEIHRDGNSIDPLTVLKAKNDRI